MQAAGASITIKGDLFLQLISVRTDMLIRDVAILDAYFFFFVVSWHRPPLPHHAPRPRRAQVCTLSPTDLFIRGFELQ